MTKLLGVAFAVVILAVLAHGKENATKTSSSPTTSTTTPSPSSRSDVNLPTSRTVLTDVIDVVLALYKDDNNTVSNSLRIPLSRAVKASTSTITSLSFGNLALLGAFLIGGLAMAAPSLFTDYRRRVGPLPAMSHPFYGNNFQELSADLIPYLENEIQRNQFYYKRNKRSLSPDEKGSLQDFLSNRFMAVSESVMVWVERGLDNMPNLPRLEAQACMKRCICEAHNQPRKYGLTGLVLQLFFPPYIENDTPSKIISKYQLAARYGRSENANCGVQYDDCIVNFLDLVQSLTNLIL